jgi:hypothetical protein
VTPPSAASQFFLCRHTRMKPPVLFAVFLWLRGFLAEVRWAWGAGRVSGTLLSRSLQAPHLSAGSHSWSALVEKESYSLPIQASVEDGKKVLQPAGLLPAPCVCV